MVYLTRIQRKIIYLKDSGLSQTEVAWRLGLSREQVQAKEYDARKRINGYNATIQKVWRV